MTTSPRVRPWVAGLILINLALGIGTWAGLIHGGDWEVLVAAAERAGRPDLYALSGTTTFVWSPVAAYVLKIVAPLGLEAWRAVLVASAVAMPTWRLRGFVLISWMFWTDFTTGNLLTVIFLAAVWSIRGSNVATFAYFAIALLIPRPLVVPLAAWILWKRREWRLPFVAMFVAHGTLVMWTGLGQDWIATLISVGPELQELAFNLGPTRFLGWWWMLIGVPLGAWLFWRGRVGLAGLAISNYVWIYYLYFALPELNRARDWPIGKAGAGPRDS